ncbi:hypothetical protein SISNIDRAFT_418590, partial [Sistotremastrum niveocremeum HHB9708]
VTTLSNLLFVCNQATNYFALLLGLFLTIEGSSVRVITCLNKLGLSVSARTVDRLRTQLSDDAIEQARKLAQGSEPWMSVIDNLNIFVRKDQQRLGNENTMLNITNCALIKFPSSFRWEMFDVPKMLSLRGLRKHFDLSLLHLNSMEQQFLKDGFIAIIAQRLLEHCPGNQFWPGRLTTRQKCLDHLPKVRPLEPIKTETFPMGVFDVDEGSKRGVIDVLTEIQVRSGLEKAEMASRVRVVAGDLLTIMNLRRARNLRSDDVSIFERLSYIAEISQPFHTGMNAVTGILQTHFGDSNLNAASLSSHKELLNRKWDPKKANYSDAKALVGHSLIARLIDCLMCIYAAWGIDGDETQREEGDHVFAQSGLFMRDTLLFEMYDHGVRNGDPGLLWAVIKPWLYSFRGAKQQNYSRECLELLVRWETELTVEMREVLERAWFYNRVGLPGRFIAIDMYLEHLNYWIKVSTILTCLR